MKSRLLGLLSLLAISFPSFATSLEPIRVPLIRLDSADCINSNVNKRSGQEGGYIIVYPRADGAMGITIHLSSGTPNTRYGLFMKCSGPVNTFKTDKEGVATVTFFLPKEQSRPLFAFDVYPEGAPPGNKFQSMQVRLP